MIDVLTGLLTDMRDGFVGFFQRSPWEVLHDCLDIGLVAVLIYWALVILRGTRAMQVAIGLCLVFVGYLFARRIGTLCTSALLVARKDANPRLITRVSELLTLERDRLIGGR